MNPATAQALRIGSLRPERVDRARLMYRLRLAVVAGGYLLLSVPALLCMVLIIVGLSLVPIGIGFAILGLVVPGTALLTGVHRNVSGALLGTHIPESYYADTTGRNILGRAAVWVRDPARWRDFAFTVVSATAGLALSVLPPTLLLSPLVYLGGLLLTGDLLWLLLLVLVSGSQVVLWWLITPALVTARALMDRGILHVSRAGELERRVEEVAASRSETLDHSAAEIRRIERDLHDGPQARIVSLGMNLSHAEQLIGRDPEAAEELLRKARETTVDVLEELRSLVRGIHPPVLAERGLSGAIEALALVVEVPVTFTATVTGRPPAPVETAVYFAVAECLANTTKHADAARAWVTLGHSDGILRVVVGDDGKGGADAAGSGLSGVRRRIEAFDGTMVVQSAVGGPTTVTMEVLCVLS